MSLKRKAADIVAAEAKKPKVNSSITSFFGPPKSTTSSTSSTNPSNGAANTAPAPAVKFDKEKWVAGLSEEQRALLKLEIETLHESWLSVLKDEITSKSFLDLKKFLKTEAETGKKIFPPSEDVYSWYVYSSSSFAPVPLTLLPGRDTHHSTPSRPSS
jgi:uracil-DNA glycosylase